MARPIFAQGARRVSNLGSHAIEFGSRPVLALTFVLLLASNGRSADVKQVVLVSIDGLPARYLDQPKARLPTLRAIRRLGATADGMITTFPSITLPAHVSLVTGAAPKSHGVLGSGVFDRRTGKPVRYTGESPYTEAEAIQVPTLYDAAHRAGLKTGAVIWPSTSGSQTLDWLIPDTGSGQERLRWMTPGLAEELAAAEIHVSQFDRSGGPDLTPLEHDLVAAQMASFLLEAKHANLVLVHINAPDFVGHSTGPDTEAGYQAAAGADRCVAQILRTLRKPALAGGSTLFVVSDHGFAEYDKLVEPNVVLKRLGLIRTNFFGSISQRSAWSSTMGGAAYVYLFDEKAVSRTAEIVAALKALPGIESVIESADFARLGLPDPRENPQMSQLMLTARFGYCIDERISGEPVADAGGRKGNHGQRPEEPRMLATFLAYGAGIKPGVRAQRVHITDVAPTIARLLRVPLPTAKGRVLEEILADIPAANGGAAPRVGRSGDRPIGATGEWSNHAKSPIALK